MLSMYAHEYQIVVFVVNTQNIHREVQNIFWIVRVEFS